MKCEEDELSDARNVPSKHSILLHGNHNMATAAVEESYQARLQKKLMVAQRTTATQSCSHSFKSDTE